MQFEKDRLLSITKAGAVCALCGQSLEEESKHLSVLVDVSPNEGEGGTDTAESHEGPDDSSAGADKDEARSDSQLRRSDYHRECWAQVAKADYLSFWLAKRPAPPATPKMSKQERNTILLGLFSALMKSNEPVDEPAKFVLSHLLMKYRALNLKGSRLDDNRKKWILFTLPQTEEEFEIPDIILNDQQMAETLQKISAYLEKAQVEAVITREEEAAVEEEAEE